MTSRALLPESRRRASARGPGLALLVLLAAAAGPAGAAETAADAATRALLEQLESRTMPDVAIWVLDRVAADPAAAADLKAEIPLRRGQALVSLGRAEADATRRAARFDEARRQFDEFLATTPQGRRAIDAYTQKGSLLVERGRLRLEQAKRPGADAPALRKDAVASFDEAIQALDGKVKPDEEVTRVDNAEDAVLKKWREAKAKVAALKPPEPADEGAKRPPPKPARRDPATAKELERLQADVAALLARLVQTRLMVANACFEKAKAFDEGSPGWKAALEDSTARFKELAEKYAQLGGGAMARCYEGRNLALLGRRKQAVETLQPLVALEDTSALAVLLRVKALTTSLECWLADETLDAFDERQRAFVIDPQKLLREVPEADRLALKYRAAEMLKAQAAALPPADAARARPLTAAAGKLALEVARANRDFATEARELVQSLGKDIGGVADRDFEGIVADAKLALATMQREQAEAKRLAAEGQDASAAVAAAAAARDEALAGFDAALAFAAAPPPGVEPPPEAALNQARSTRAYLLYDAARYAEAGELGMLLVEQFPNAPGSRQAATIALASFQQLAKSSDATAAAAARDTLGSLARSIARIWPGEKEGAEAQGVLMAMAIESRDAPAVIELADALPPAGAGRPALLARAGTALWREALEQGRPDAPAAAAAWKDKARGYLDTALAAPAGAIAPPRVAAAAALSRAQIALEDGDAAAAVSVLEAPGAGPWNLVADPQADPALRTGSFAETTLTVALRAFIQADELDKAQQAMDRLEALAGAAGSAEQSARLTTMYLSMGRELQQQLERLAGAADPAARAKAAATLGGFEKFLDGVEKRDAKVSSRIWVATTYLTLGSGTGTGAVVSKPQADRYLDRAAEVYEKLLEAGDDPDVARFEPSIRLKLAAIHRDRGRWDEARKQVDWILSDAARQNSLDAQVEAAGILQAEAEALAATDAAAAETAFQEAASGRAGGPIWGWGGIAAKVGRQAFAGHDAKAIRARELFFTARLNQATCLVARARLPGVAAGQATDLLAKAATAVTVTRKLYPDLGGPAPAARFEALLKEIQRQQGATNPRGFAELDEQAQTTPAGAVAN